LSREDYLASGREALRLESEAIQQLAEGLDERFSELVETILGLEGRVIMTGIGKSGAVASKLASTFASTGTPALFLHPAEAVHGDLGMVTKRDLIIALSHSGSTDEVLRLVPTIRRLGAKLACMTGVPESQLAKAADLVLPVRVRREACPHNLAPTTSTTALLAMGDALAITVMKARQFTREQFALFHPAGALGRALLRVGDVMHKGEYNPTIGPDASVEETLLLMMSSELRGVANIVSPEGKLLGIFTDGDLRRSLKKDRDVLQSRIGDVMTKNPTTIAPDKLATEALALMEARELDNLPVVDEQGNCLGVIDVQDLLKSKVV